MGLGWLLGARIQEGEGVMVPTLLKAGTTSEMKREFLARASWWGWGSHWSVRRHRGLRGVGGEVVGLRAGMVMTMIVAMTRSFARSLSRSASGRRRQPCP